MDGLPAPATLTLLALIAVGLLTFAHGLWNWTRVK